MKSLHIKLSECLEKMSSKQRDKFYESRKSGSPIEVQVNCAEAILSGKVKESTPVTKHNGRGDNGTLFTESNSGGEWVDPREVQIKAYTVLGLTEAEARKVVGLPPERLTRAQAAEYSLAVSSGISEADALRLCKK